MSAEISAADQDSNPSLTNEARAHLRWALTPDIGPVLFSRICEAFGGAEAALGATAGQLTRIHGIGRDSSGRIARSRDQVDVAPVLRKAAELGLRIICRADAEYPAALRAIPDAPIVLYARGTLLREDALAVAIVGTRRCSTYGAEQARRFGELLAGVGVTVVSGLARGIDAAAHRGALEGGGRTIAVVGDGLATIYPPEHVELAERMVERGALLTELPPGSAVRAENFPARNRIIAGMTLGTLVIEAPQRSGALISARCAAEYNREVFALPGRVNEPNAFGVNRLIRDGAAKLTTCVEDILAELGEVGAALRRSAASAKAERSPRSAGRRGTGRAANGGGEPLFEQPAIDPAVALTGVERSIFERLGDEAITSDALLTMLDAPTGEALAALTALELKGLIRRLPGQIIKKGI